MSLRHRLLGGAAVFLVGVGASYPLNDERKPDSAVAPVAMAVIPPAAPSSVPIPVADKATPPAPVAPTAVSVKASQHIVGGDKVKVQFYQIVNDVEAEKWKGGARPTEFQLYPELSGEYTVQDDGTISFPLLGSVLAANRTAQDLQSGLAVAFKEATTHKGFVTIAFLERPPVYVLGPVKTPGAYKYAPGMTVLHALALAGGSTNQGLEPFQRIEVMRASLRSQNAFESMSDLLARGAVLKAERDHIAPQPPARLIQMVGEADAIKLIAAETDRRSAIVGARAMRLKMMISAVESAKAEFATMSKNAHPYDDLIKMREKRAAAMRTLQGSGYVNNNYVIQAQGELADTEQHRLDAMNTMTQAQQRVSQLQEEQVRAESETRSDLDNALIGVEKQIVDSQRESDENNGVLEVLNVSGSGPGNLRLVGGLGADTATAAYELVRQTPNGPVKMAANPMTVLEPGDLIQVTPRVVDQSSSSPSPARPIRAEPVTLTPMPIRTEPAQAPVTATPVPPAPAPAATPPAAQAPAAQAPARRKVSNRALTPQEQQFEQFLSSVDEQWRARQDLIAQQPPPSSSNLEQKFEQFLAVVDDQQFARRSLALNQ